jgi:hypothetical protein
VVHIQCQMRPKFEYHTQWTRILGLVVRDLNRITTTITTSISLLLWKAEHRLLASDYYRDHIDYHRDDHLTTIAKSTIYYRDDKHRDKLSITIATTILPWLDDYYRDEHYYRDRITTTIATSISLLEPTTVATTSINYYCYEQYYRDRDYLLSRRLLSRRALLSRSHRDYYRDEHLTAIAKRRAPTSIIVMTRINYYCYEQYYRDPDYLLSR